ncbi:hypothetical protein [Mucilaginibacter sp. CSA2-8R]|uniref:hypothetical protein n=1 Tax=Mucilaginibacter sp. CSA2-8R TaxID=3141542 RepID=UPI00315D5FD8
MILFGSKSYDVKVSQSVEDIFKLLNDRIKHFKQNEAPLYRFLLLASDTAIDYSKVNIEENVIALRFPNNLYGIIIVSLVSQDAQHTLLHCVIKPRLNGLFIFSLLLSIFFAYAIIISPFIFHSHLWLIITTGLLMAGVLLLNVKYTLYQLKSYLVEFLADLNIKPDLRKLQKFTDSASTEKIRKI